MMKRRIAVGRIEISNVLLPSTNLSNHTTTNPNKTNTNGPDNILDNFTAVTSFSSSTFLVRHSNPWREEVLRMGVPKASLARHGRGSSCASEESSGVSSCCSAECGSQVTVNGQHHCVCTAIVGPFLLKGRSEEYLAEKSNSANMSKMDSANVLSCTECNDTLSTCSKCDQLLLV